MAENVGYATLGIIPSFKGFESQLNAGSSKAMTAAGATGGTKFGDAAGSAASAKFKTHIKSVAKIAAVGFAAAGAAAFKFGGDAIDEAREAQKVGALTASTIKATGGAAKVTAKHVGNLAGKISDVAGIDDEAIQSGANMLLTFKNIRNEAGEGNKVFDKTLTTLVDLSAAMGTDAKSSAIQLGKALNDPVKGISALSRVGVTFTDQQKDQIKALVASGHTMKAQKIILRELNSEFGGAAAAQATASDKLDVAWGNLKESVGTKLLPVMDDFANFLRKKGIPALEDAGDWVNDEGIPAMKNFAEEIKPVVSGAKDLAGFLNDLPAPAKLAGLTALFGGIGYTKLRGGNSMGATGGALGTIGKAVGLAKPVPVFVTNMGTGLGGPGGPGKIGTSWKIAALSVSATSVAIAAGNAAAIKANEGNGIELGAQAPGAAGPGLNLPKGFLDFTDSVREYDKSLGIINNGWSKVKSNTDKARESTILYDGTIRRVPTLWNTVFGAPGLARDLALVKEYGSLLDGLPRQIKTEFVQSVTRNNTLEPVGGNAGRTPRSGVTINVGTVQAHDYRDFTKQMNRHARGSAGGGVYFP